MSTPILWEAISNNLLSMKFLCLCMCDRERERNLLKYFLKADGKQNLIIEDVSHKER
jgi:hypothetical protein